MGNLFLQFLSGTQANGSPIPDKEVTKLRHIVVGDENICDFERTETGFLVRDLGTAERTLVNGEPVQGSRILNDGDEIQAASVRIRALIIAKNMLCAYLQEGATDDEGNPIRDKDGNPIFSLEYKPMPAESESYAKPMVPRNASPFPVYPIVNDGTGLWLRDPGTGRPPLVNDRPVFETRLSHGNIVTTWENGKECCRKVTIERSTNVVPPVRFHDGLELAFDGWIPTVFLSCVTREFNNEPGEFHQLKTQLIHEMDTSDAKTLHQNNILYPGKPLLEGLRLWIERSKFVIHLVGRQAGYSPIQNPPDDDPDWKDWRPETHAAITEVYKKVRPTADELGLDERAIQALSYTQWEYLIARHYQKEIFVFVPKEAEKDLNILKQGADESQKRHIDLIDKDQYHRNLIGKGQQPQLPMTDAVSIARKIHLKIAEFHEDASLEGIRNWLDTNFAPMDDAGLSTEYAHTPRRVAEERMMNKSQHAQFGEVEFHGRQWLHDKLTEQQQHASWLEADAGFGKSRFVAELACGWKVTSSRPTGDFHGPKPLAVGAVVFCDPNTGPLDAVREIIRQLRCTSHRFAEGFAQRLQDLKHDELKILGTLRPARLTNDPSTNPNTPEGTAVAGNTTESQKADDQIETLIRLLLLDLLKQGDPQFSARRKRLIIIDGLDEVLRRLGGTQFNPLEKLLKTLLSRELPNDRFLVTSRPIEMCLQLKRLDACIPKGMWLNMHPKPEPDNVVWIATVKRETDKDARQLLKREFGRIDAEKRPVFDPRWRDPLILDQLLVRSEYSMLYLSLMPGFILREQLRPENVGSLPHGMAGIYERQFDRFFSQREEDADRAKRAAGKLRFEQLIRPFLQVLAAAEQLKITVSELACCFDEPRFLATAAPHVARTNDDESKAEKSPEPLTIEHAIAELKQSLSGLMVDNQRPLFRQQDKKIDGKSQIVLEPFHLSFMDWLVDRRYPGDPEAEKRTEHHKYWINPAEGERLLAEWVWSEYSTRQADSDALLPPDAGRTIGTTRRHRDDLNAWTQAPFALSPIADQFWVVHGATHLLQTFQHFYPVEKDLPPRLHPCIGHEAKPALRQQIGYLVRGIDFLGWLNFRQEHKNENIADIDKVIAAALPLLDSVLSLSVKTENEDDPIDSKILDELEFVDQITLYELIKDSGATKLIEDVITWIGKTQVYHWELICQRILEQDEWVIRNAAGIGQAARYMRFMNDSELVDERPGVIDEIDMLLASDNVDELEMGVIAVCELASDPLCSGYAPDDEVLRWLRMLSEDKFDLYFCQTVLGDLLLDVILKGFQKDPKTTRINKAVLQEFETWDRLEEFRSFWTPAWKHYGCQGVIDVLGQYVVHGRDLPHRDKELSLFRKDVDDYVKDSHKREARIEKFRCAEDVIDEAQREQELLSRKRLVIILNQPELSSPADDDEIWKWMISVGVNPQVREKSAIEYLHLMFTHVNWRMGESGAGMISQLASKTHDEAIAVKLLKQLRNSLGTPETSEPASILGVSEACYLARHLKDATEKVDGEEMSLIEACFRDYFRNEDFDVTGLLAEDLCLLVNEEFSRRKGNDFNPVFELLDRHNEEVELWLQNSEIWVLEHVYQLFRCVRRHLDKALKSSKGPTKSLMNWPKERLAVIAEHDCLLSDVFDRLKLPLVPYPELDKMDRTTLLRTLQQLQWERLPEPRQRRASVVGS